MENDGENLIKKFLEKTLSKNLYKTPHFHPMDFFITKDNDCYSEKTTYIEVKDRDMNSDAYMDTIVGTNKIRFASSVCDCIDTYFYFIFKDKILCIKYDDNLFNTFDTTIKYGKEHLKIPLNLCNEILTIHQ